LVETPEVAAKLGIEFRNGELKLLGGEAQVSKAVRHVINDLTRSDKKKLSTKDIYHKEQRIEYAKQFACKRCSC